MCNYFKWHDLVANSCQKRIIVALMKKVDELNLRENDLQTKINDMKMKGKFLGIRLVFSWVCVCFHGFHRLCSMLELKSLYTDYHHHHAKNIMWYQSH